MKDGFVLGDIYVDVVVCYFYYIEEGGIVMWYGVVIVCGNFYELGIYIIWWKVEWLYWILIVLMIEWNLENVEFVDGMELGLKNVFGLCVFYFYVGNWDIYFCIYGIFKFWLIGGWVSFGCVWMVMVYINDFYLNVVIGLIVYLYFVE